MRGTRVAPTVDLSAPIENHLEAAGVSQPTDVAHRMSEQEYDSWHEIVLLTSNELKDLMELVGLKHKSATKLARYAEDFRRYNQPELAAERPESIMNQHVETVDSELTMEFGTDKLVDTMGDGQQAMNEQEPDSPKTTGSLLTNDNVSISSGIANIVPTNSLQQVDSNMIGSNELIAKATAAAQDKSDFASAVELFREAIELNRQSDAAWFGLGYSLYQRDGGNTEEQIACYERTIELNPKHAMARSNLGNQLLTLRKDFKNAEQQFRTAIELDSSCADAHNHLGWLLQHSKGEAGADEAEVQFRAAIALDPTYTDAHVNLGWLMQNIRKDFPSAELCYRDAIELDANNVQATYNLGVLLDSKGDDVGKAEERYRRAIELDPNNVLALVSLGRLLEKRDTKGAEKCYRQAIAVDPLNASAHNCLGVVLEIGSPVRVDEAESHYRKAIELDPTHSSANYNLGLLLEVVKRDYTGAEACYRKTISLDPTNANALSNLGILLKDIRRDYDSAEKCYRQAIEVDPQHSAACNNLGTLLETVRGDLEGAEVMYRRAMYLDMKNADAVLNLGILLHGKAERLENTLKDTCPNMDPTFLTPETTQLAQDAAKLYYEAAGLWDLSDGEGNRYSSASRQSASQLKALCSLVSRPSTPSKGERGGSFLGLHASNISPIIRHSRPTSARSRPTSANNHRPSSASRPPSSQSSRSAQHTGFTGVVTDNPQLYTGASRQHDGTPTLSSSSQHISPHISPQDAAIVSGIGMSGDVHGESSATSRPWAAAADAAERAAQELAVVAMKLESYTTNTATPTTGTSSDRILSKDISTSFSSVVGTSQTVSKAVDQLDEVASTPNYTLEGFKLDGEESEDTLAELFKIVDKNGDGGVTRLELKKALNHKGEEGDILRAKLCKTLGIPAAVTDRKARDVFEHVFDCIDVDCGASLQLEEMQRFVRDMKMVHDIYEKSQQSGYDPAANSQVVNRIVRLLELSDINRDGKLSHAEIIRSMKYHPNIRKYLNNEPADDDD